MKFYILVLLFLYNSLFANELVREATNNLMSDLSGTYQDNECGKLEYSVHLEDLNNDNIKEMFIIKYGSCLGGGAGMNVDLLIKQYGSWESQFNFPGGYKILKETNLGFHDILITGPGFCFPVWRWNGEKYESHRKTCDH